MSRQDWFRRTQWTSGDAAAFDQRLARSRSVWNKAQYLYIQALTLHDTGDPTLLAPCLALCERGIRETPHRAMLAGLHLVRGRALADLGHANDAIAAWRDSLAAQRAYPGMKHLAHLELAELIVASRRTALYAEAEAACIEFGAYDGMWPQNQFRHSYVRAVIAAARGDAREAAQFARSAIAAAGKTESPFPYHRRLGLVSAMPPEVLDELNRLAAA